MSIKGAPYASFRRSLETRKLSIVLPAAAELDWINLSDSVPGRRRPPFRSEIRTRAGAALPRALHCPRRGLTPRRPATDVEPLCRHFSTPSRLLTGQCLWRLEPPPRSSENLGAAGLTPARLGAVEPVGQCGAGARGTVDCCHERESQTHHWEGSYRRRGASLPPRSNPTELKTEHAVRARPGPFSHARHGLCRAGDSQASLEILVLMAEAGDPRYERSAARWIGRLLTETPPMTLKEARWAIAMVEQLPRCRESLQRLARRR